ncbi:serine/threonine-protein kinase ULK2 isoform X2 [Patella vulgata]|uniref:serine/threonine-protein kinase ULK2 isoform X2 n=1 Tax=Patella vulgata TaxID=6465 RepID=UPI00217F86BB|nr:serine/threonine-protein kinase ULK2 isoform X2 [Patella vulgata]
MEIIGDYEYNKKDLIGHGAFAVVFKGRYRKKPDVAVAIKSITKKNIAKSQQLLSKEIKILKELSDLHHENVVGLLDCKETSNHVYLVMEYCNGGDLADYLHVKGTLSEDTIVVLLRQIAAAMKALNGKGIVHRDLKPQNILLCHVGKKNPQASDLKLKIADFGFARFLQDGVMAATLCGSPMYMAPEVIMSLQYDAKADLWSIGTIVFQCLTGKAPFQAQTPQQLKQFYEKHSELKPNIPQTTSPELRDLLLKLLKRNAKDRIEFDDFFIHPFLKPVVKTTSSPVPVPNRSPTYSSEGSTPGKHTTSSPSSSNMDFTTSPQQGGKDDVFSGAPGSEAEEDFLKIEKEQARRPISRSPPDDFVLVPPSLPSDNSGGSMGAVLNAPLAEEEMDIISDGPPHSLRVVAASPATGTVTFRKDAQTSPSRPATLCVSSPTTSPTPSDPIPVPSQMRAYQKLHTTSPTSPVIKRIMSDSPIRVEKNRTRRYSENVLSGPDIGSLSPPSVQFSIGTPPSTTGQWRRSSANTPPTRPSGTPPSITGSPLRRSAGSSPRISPLPFGSCGALPTILGSPTKLKDGYNFKQLPEPITQDPVPFGCNNRDNVPAIGFREISPENSRLEYHRSNTDPEFNKGTSLLSQQLLRAAFAHPPPGTVVPFSNGRSNSRENIDKQSSLERERSSSFFRRSSSSFMETSPPVSGLYAQSPPNMEGPITFVAPELSEETLMDDEHNEIMAKLTFVLDLVECIMELAQVRGAALTSFTDSFSSKQGDSLPAEQVPRFTEAQRHLEQLVLYVRSLHLLSSALQLSRQEIKMEKLQASNTLRSVLCDMNKLYHKCVSECRILHQRLAKICKTPLTPQLVVSTADKLIYNYAIEMCQSAALDELFGNPQECFRRYTVAQILLHSLAQQTRNARDKDLLNKYKLSVEHRLSNLQTPGTVPA